VAAAGIMPLAAACGPLRLPARPQAADLVKVQQKLLLWGPGDTIARQAQVELWNRQHPNLPLERAPTPYGGQGIAALEKFLVAVAAGSPADVAWIDRFQIANLAARRTLMALDPYLKRDKYDLKRHFVPLLEEVYGIDGKVYALPSSTDNRAFWWNKRLFREAGLNADRGPATWDELRAFAARTTRTASDGSIAQLGWTYRLPGAGMLYLYGRIFGAEFLSKDGRKAQYNSPGVIEALTAMLNIVDAMGGTVKVDQFLAGQNAMQLFLNDRIAMQVPQPLAAIAAQRPEMEFGWNHIPLRRASDKIQTFAGGFSWTVPAGVKNPEVSWALAAELLSEESLVAWADAAAGVVGSQGGAYLPGFTTVQEVDRKLRQRYATRIAAVDKAWDFVIDLMKYARVRPVSPAAAEAWDALLELWDSVFSRKQTPREAADLANARVQKALDESWATIGRR